MDNMTQTQFLMTLRLARKRLPAARASRQDDVDYHAQNGHIPEYCIHGTYRWTDYDNICGGCEDGVTLRQMVVEGAWRDVTDFFARVQFIDSAAKVHAPVDITALWDWAVEPIK